MEAVVLQVVGLLISLTLIIMFFSKKHIKNNETKIYSILLVLSFLFILVGILTFVVAKITNDFFLISVFQKIYMSILVFLCYLSIKYCVSVFKINFLNKKIINLILDIVTIIFVVLVFILPLKVIFYDNILDGEGHSYNVAMIYCFISFVLILSLTTYLAIKGISIKKIVPFLILIVLYLIGFVLRGAYRELIFEGFFYSYIFLIMYHTIENPDVKMVRELEYAKNMAEKANRAKSDFLSSMSHEIRTPLNAIVGLSEVIKNSDDIDEIHEDANDVVMASKNLLEIVNGILDISKIEADKMEIIESNYNPVETFGEITSLIESKLDEKNLELNCNFALDLPTTLYGDKGKLKQIISNILSNAIKYTEKGHIDFNVNCINEKTKCKLQIIISDTGRGIKPEQIDKIFNKFERAEEDMNSTIEGTGLGLAITKSLVEMMDGKIFVHSTYGEGSKFTVLLEQKYSKDEETIKVVKDEKVSYSDKKALVVDDNKLNIKVASKILREFELNIDSSDSGFSAIEKIENDEHYDIIFMDIMMPKMSGVETLKKLKQIENFNTPVVALTADVMHFKEGKSTKYIEVGFNDYLSKPINKHELKRVLDKYLNGINKIKEEDFHIHKIIPITDEDIEELNKL